jgi:P27 family predicted phage terminase small subunit
VCDLRGFELLCVTLASETEAREMLQREGLTVPTADGGRKPHPAVRVAETARAQAARLLDAFGLTPQGRQSIDVAPLRAPSPADRYLLR